ncbi:hypothetical protein BOX15_Mlig013927g2 [Macrostomum lignano]|uniref:SOCS box domain-containing protein n=1 Tax=Macrostomum lignano TaxID=282301 RepID=A0A267FXF5_9PLAT|nr:hypothetical protein BOX15_Mlig013927g2 [Macrostomum lignano]
MARRYCCICRILFSEFWCRIQIGTGFLPLVHDLVSEARKPKELLLQLIECCRVGLDEKQAADTVNRLVNSRDQYGFTPLHRAVRSGSDEAAEILLANGADATAVTDRDRRTALHIHLWLGCGPLAYRLLHSGADPDACDADNWTPLHWCAKNAHLDFAKHLICKRGVRLFRSQGCTLSPLKLCLQQINQCVNGPIARTQQQQQPQQQQEDVLQSLFAIARLLLRHGAVLPAQSFLADWLVATSSDNVRWSPQNSTAQRYTQLVHLLAAEGADYVILEDVDSDAVVEPADDVGVRTPRSLVQLCRLSIRSRLRLLSGGRSILSRLNRLPLPPRLLRLVDLPDLAVGDGGENGDFTCAVNVQYRE